MTEWNGRGVPQIPVGATIRVVFRGGHETVSRYGDVPTFDWGHNDSISDIIGYEVLLQSEQYYLPLAEWGGSIVGDPAYLAEQAQTNADIRKAFAQLEDGGEVVNVEWADYSASRELVARQTEQQLGNTDADGEGKQTNPKDLVGSRKAPLSTLPFRVLWRVGLAMLEGMCKYGRHNYRIAGVRASVYFDGAMRHLGAWWEGEDIDHDSGFNHIDKLIADLMVLRDSMLQGNWVDDRPPMGQEDFVMLNSEAARIVDLHKDKKVRHFTIADTRRAA